MYVKTLPSKLKNMPEVLLIIIVGTFIFLLLGVFIIFMTLTYQKKRLLHEKEVNVLVEAYQKEILQARLEMQEQTLLLISQEIHDNVGQVLSLVRLNISTLPGSDNSGTDQKIATSKLLLDQALEDLRNLSKRLNSQFIIHQNLSDLLRFQLELIQKTGAVATNLELKGEERSMNPEKKLILFRIAQEAFSNVIRHAEATLITVMLDFASDKLLLSICDNGKGFVTTLSGTDRNVMGTGTHNMHYRASLIGAVLHLNSSIGQGTKVTLSLPYS